MKPLSSSHWVTPAMASTLPGAADERLPRQRLARRHALQDGVDGGEQHRRLLAALDAGEPRQRRHALRHHAGMRRHAVVGQAIPGRKFQHLDVGREEGERARQRRHARAVAADHHEADRRRARRRRRPRGRDRRAPGLRRRRRRRQAVSGRPGASRSAGDRAWIRTARATASSRRGPSSAASWNAIELSQHGGVVVRPGRPRSPTTQA